MEERFYGVSRWLVALTVIFIPLSLLIMITGSWGANFVSHQWTRFLLFASWILLTLSLISGVSNLISPPLEEGKAEPPAVLKEEPEKAGGEEEDEEESPRGEKRKPGVNVGYASLLAQASTFVLGILVYIIYISWTILPKISVTGY